MDKMKDLWKLLVPDPNDDSVKPRDFMWKEFPTFFQMDMNGVFLNVSDELNKNRPKTTHTQGLVA